MRAAEALSSSSQALNNFSNRHTQQSSTPSSVSRVTNDQSSIRHGRTVPAHAWLERAKTKTGFSCQATEIEKSIRDESLARFYFVPVASLVRRHRTACGKLPGLADSVSMADDTRAVRTMQIDAAIRSSFTVATQESVLRTCSTGPLKPPGSPVAETN